jgi:hypothetical protein
MRFKTEQEFIKEFGEHWKRTVDWNFDGKMDYLFGTELPKQDEEYFKKYRGPEECTRSHDLRWSIDRRMLTESKTESKNVIFLEDEPSIILDQNN